jgi:Cu2+-exporting ATPase
VYLRDHRVWERALRVRQVVFDKTGTLTLESPRLANPEHLASSARRTPGTPCSRSSTATWTRSVAACAKSSRRRKILRGWPGPRATCRAPA